MNRIPQKFKTELENGKKSEKIELQKHQRKYHIGKIRVAAVLYSFFDESQKYKKRNLINLRLRFCILFISFDRKIQCSYWIWDIDIIFVKCFFECNYCITFCFQKLPNIIRISPESNLEIDWAVSETCINIFYGSFYIIQGERS